MGPEFDAGCGLPTGGILPGNKHDTSQSLLDARLPPAAAAAANALADVGVDGAPSVNTMHSYFVISAYYEMNSLHRIVVLVLIYY